MAKKQKTAERQKIFLRVFERKGTVRRAADAADVSRQTVSRWRKNNKRFAAAFEAIRDDHDDMAYGVIHDAIDEGDLQAARWLLTRPGRRFDPHRETRLREKIGAAEQQQILLREEAGKFLAREMADRARRTEILAEAEAVAS